MIISIISYLSLSSTPVNDQYHQNHVCHHYHIIIIITSFSSPTVSFPFPSLSAAVNAARNSSSVGWGILLKNTNFLFILTSCWHQCSICFMTMTISKMRKDSAEPGTCFGHHCFFSPHPPGPVSGPIIELVPS